MSCLDLKKNKDDFYNYTTNLWKMGELSNRSANLHNKMILEKSDGEEKDGKHNSGPCFVYCQKQRVV